MRRGGTSQSTAVEHCDYLTTLPSRCLWRTRPKLACIGSMAVPRSRSCRCGGCSSDRATRGPTSHPGHDVRTVSRRAALAYTRPRGDGLRPVTGFALAPVVGVAIGAALVARSTTLRAEGKVTVKTPARKSPLSVSVFAKLVLASRVRLNSKAALLAVSAAVAGTA